MTSLLPPAYDGGRRQSMAGSMHLSPASSPAMQRPPSQPSLNLPSASAYSPDFSHNDHQFPFSAYPTQTQPQAFRPYQPTALSLPGPNAYLSGGYPSTAPPLPYYPNTATAQIYDPRGSQPMIRTISHAHPMNSATDHTASSRYSSSPHSATGPLVEASPTASGQQLNPYPTLGLNQSAFSISNADFQDQQRMVNTNLFVNGGYSMSRSTSGASDTHEVQRLVTPSFDMGMAKLSPDEAELRKVSDTLGDPTKRYYSSTFTPSFDLQSHALSLGPHPQPDGILYAGRGLATDQFNFPLGRSDDKPDGQFFGETEYERERQAQILNNRKLLAEVGLSGSGFATSRSRMPSGQQSQSNRKSSTIRKRLQIDAPVRASPRIRQMSRTVSYAELDGGPRSISEEPDDEYDSEADVDEEEDFRPSKRSKGRQGYRIKSASYTGGRSQSKAQLSLWGLLQVYGDIPHLFPLFYYTLNNDLTLNSDSVPLIGSVPSTCTPIEKAEMLQAFFHRGKRVQAQLDAFTARCDKKYEGADVRWPELDYHTRIAIRDVRRKVVERCENYKYTRRDILDKMLGKNKWQPIEQGMIEWHPGMAQNDPAGDLAHVTLTLPTPPPDAYSQQMRSASSSGSRSIKPLPGHRSRMVSAAPRTVSIAMGEPEDTMLSRPHTAAYPSGVPMYYAPTEAPPPMYGEDQVPMTVQLSGGPTSSTAAMPQTANFADGSATPWHTTEDSEFDQQRGIKRSRSDESGSPEA